MRFIYTRHVRLRMRQRGVSTREIEAAMNFPDRVAPSFKNRMVAQKVMGGRRLEVVFRRLNGQVVIMTAYWLEEGA